MSEARRLSHGLGKIFAHLGTQNTPNRDSMSRIVTMAANNGGNNTTPRGAAVEDLQHRDNENDSENSHSENEAHDLQLLQEMLTVTCHVCAKNGYTDAVPESLDRFLSIDKLHSLLEFLCGKCGSNKPIVQALGDLGINTTEHHETLVSIQNKQDRDIEMHATTYIVYCLYQLAQFVEIWNGSTSRPRAHAREHDYIGLLNHELILRSWNGEHTESIELVVSKWLGMAQPDNETVERDNEQLSHRIEELQSTPQNLAAARAEQKSITTDMESITNFKQSVASKLRTAEHNSFSTNEALKSAIPRQKQLASTKAKYEKDLAQKHGIGSIEAEKINLDLTKLQSDRARVQSRVIELQLELSNGKTSLHDAKEIVQKFVQVAAEVVPDIALCSTESPELGEAREFESKVHELIQELHNKRLEIEKETMELEVQSAKWSDEYRESLSQKSMARSRLEDAMSEASFHLRESTLKEQLAQKRLEYENCARDSHFASQKLEHQRAVERKLELEARAMEMQKASIETIETRLSKTGSKIDVIESFQSELVPGVRTLQASAAAYTEVIAGFEQFVDGFASDFKDAQFESAQYANVTGEAMIEMWRSELAKRSGADLKRKKVTFTSTS